MLYRWANLTEEQLERVRAFETRTGKTALALTRLDLEPAELTLDEELELIALERDTDSIVIVIK